MGKLLRPAKPLDDEAGLHLLVLDVLVIRKFGPRALAWESIVLHDELSRAFGEPGPLTWQRVQAARAMHLRDSFWTEWEVFEKCALVLCGRIPDFQHVQLLEAEDLAVAISTAARIDRHDYSEDVKRYIASACLNDGLWYVEPPIEPLAGPAIQAYVAEHGLSVDPGAVLASLTTRAKVDESADDPVEVQVNRVLSVRDALARYDRALSEQLARIPAILGEADDRERGPRPSPRAGLLG